MHSKKGIVTGCVDCPYIRGGSDDINNTYCVKVGCHIGDIGCCEEEKVMSKSRSYQNPRKLNRYERKKKYKDHLKLIARYKLSHWSAPAYPVDEDGHWHGDIDSCTYIKREYRGSRSKYLKKRSDRALRRYTGDLSKHGWYRKVYDLWWEMY